MADKVHKMGVGPRGGTLYVFHCPGCGYGHPFEVPQWSWNGSLDKPTFTPSLRCNGGTPSECHCVVTDGIINFCPDCWHPLAGQSVEMPDWEY